MIKTPEELEKRYRERLVDEGNVTFASQQCEGVDWLWIYNRNHRGASWASFMADVREGLANGSIEGPWGAAVMLALQNEVPHDFREAFIPYLRRVKLSYLVLETNILWEPKQVDLMKPILGNK